MHRLALLSALLLSTMMFAADPWLPADVVAPAAVAKDLKTPLIIHVGFPVMYRSAHIPNTPYAGPGSKPEGIEDLKKAVAGVPKDREIVLYCGCCPWDKCPNVRPAFASLHALGYTKVRVMKIDENLKTDWIDKGYPTDKRSDSQQ